MKNLTRLSLLLALIWGFASQSHAALLVEPVVGYSLGKATSEVTGTNPEDSKTRGLSGTSYGGRLGYQNFGFQLGLDYLNSMMKTSGDKFNTSEWAGFVGFEFPVLFRVYAGYIFSGTGQLKADETVNFKSGSGPKVGLGFTLLPFLDINVEYRQVKFDDKDIGAGDTMSMKYEAVMVGLSLPFTI